MEERTRRAQKAKLKEVEEREGENESLLNGKSKFISSRGEGGTATGAGGVSNLTDTVATVTAVTVLDFGEEDLVEQTETPGPKASTRRSSKAKLTPSDSESDEMDQISQDTQAI